MPINYLNSAKTIFWDFDGVIKDSVEVKSDAFEQLFLPFGKEIAKKVRVHHEENGGISRFDKLPIYIEWAEQKPTQEAVNEYALKFSTLVKKKVVNSEWVPGVTSYLNRNCNTQQFFLVTATPQQEIEDILILLKIKHLFKVVVGSPTRKTNAIESIMKKYSILSKDSIMIGDSSSDYNAAKINGVPFILRRTELNKKLQQKLDCLMISNYLDLNNDMKRK
jgi:phosphoglycolate phosphatase-like HAD superfamily hydrolase